MFNKTRFISLIKEKNGGLKTTSLTICDSFNEILYQYLNFIKQEGFSGEINQSKKSVLYIKSNDGSGV